ncbi:MAG: non-canonical purine NTP pyrophosphatase [Bacilli bacterium]|nr:non-canonical purine NTP pyrophosphatase [Bacilli bacterium]
MKKVLFATGNPAKVKRFAKDLLKRDIELLSLKDIDTDIEVEENGKDATENAIIKAKACYEATGMSTLAMDDTLYIENIKEELQPGMYVRRVGGKRLNDEEMIEYYSSLARKYGTSGKLTAKWVYGMALINKGEIKTYTWSKNDFYIVETPSSIIKQGYPLNSISMNKKLNKYFTDMTKEDIDACKENETDVIDFIASNLE